MAMLNKPIARPRISLSTVVSTNVDCVAPKNPDPTAAMNKALAAIATEPLMAKGMSIVIPNATPYHRLSGNKNTRRAVEFLFEAYPECDATYVNESTTFGFPESNDE